MSTPMPPEPLTLSMYHALRATGENLILRTLNLFGECMLWGIYLLVTVYAVYNLWRKNQSRYRIHLIAIVTMFLTSTVQLALSMHRSVAYINNLMMRPPGDSGETMDDRLAPNARPDRLLFYIGNLLFSFEFLMGDAVVLWRTWILWSRRRRVMIFPFLLWFLALVIYPVERVIWVKCGGLDGRQSPVPICAAGNGLYLTAWTLSMATNGIATCLIAYRAREHRREQRTAAMRLKSTHRILTLLVESGFIYLLFWAVQTSNFALFTEFGPGPVFVANITSMGAQVVGLYPTLIIVIIQLRISYWDAPTVDHSSHASQVVSSLQFAPPEMSRDAATSESQLDVPDIETPGDSSLASLGKETKGENGKFTV